MAIIVKILLFYSIKKKQHNKGDNLILIYTWPYTDLAN